MQMLGGRSSGDSYAPAQQSTASRPEPAAAMVEDGFDDDIPF
jgi:hypothetical protein